MDFRMTDEQELLLESIEEWLLNSGFDDGYFNEQYKNALYPVEFFKAMGESGFGTLGLPEEFGGTPIDCQTLMLVNLKTYSLGYPNLIGTMLQIDDMLTFGSKEQQKIIFDILAKVDGTRAFCLGFSEPQAGSDSLAVATTATRKNGKVYINGQKTMITCADISKYMLTITRDFESPKPVHQTISMYLVPLDAPGVRIENMHKIGWKLNGSFCNVYLDNVELEESSLVGVEGNGFLQLMKNFEVERLLMACSSAGMAICSYNDAVKYANQRVQFGKPIAKQQLIQEKIVNMAIKIENMKNYIMKCAWEKDQGMSLQTSANLCKIYCCQAAFEVCDDAMQILGGIGYTEDVRISRMWLDTRVNRIGGGTDEILTTAAAKQIIKSFK